MDTTPHTRPGEVWAEPGVDGAHECRGVGSTARSQGASSISTPHGSRGAWLNARSPRTRCQPFPSAWSSPLRPHRPPPPALPKRRRERGEKWLIPPGHHPTVHVSVLSSEKYTRPQASRPPHGHRTGLLRAGTHSPPAAQDEGLPPAPRHGSLSPSLRHATVLAGGGLGNDFF